MHPSMDCSALCFEQQCTLANSRVHSYRFVHSLAWETLLTLGNTTCLSNTLSLYSSFQKRGFTKCPSFRFMQKISGNTTHCIGEHNFFCLQILLISLLPFQSLLVWNIFHFYKCEWILEKYLAMCYQQILKLSVCGGKIENFIASLCDCLGRWVLIKIGWKIHLSLDLVGLHAFIGIGRKIHLRGLWLILALNSLSSFPLHWIWSKSDKYHEI